MMIERIGKWLWSLSPEERLAAVAASEAQRMRIDIAPARLKRIHDAMLVKQKKLAALAVSGRARAGAGAWPYRT